MSPWLRPEERLPRRQIIRRWTEHETDAQFVADRVRPMLHAGRYVEQVPGAGLELGGDSFLLAPDLYDHAARDDEFDLLVVMMGPLLRREIAPPLAGEDRRVRFLGVLLANQPIAALEVGLRTGQPPNDVG